MEVVVNNPYVTTKNTPTVKNFRAYYPVDINHQVDFMSQESSNISQRMYYETTVGRICIDALARYIVGCGLSPVSSPERQLLPSWDDTTYRNFTKQAEAYYRMITDNPESIDYYGKNNFKQLQIIAFKDMLITGDVLLHTSYHDRSRRFRPYVQLLSGKWVRNPGGLIDTKDLAGGVYLSNGREIGYSIVKVDENLNDTTECRRVNKYNPRTKAQEYDLIHVGDKESNQLRGIPVLSSVRDDLLQISSFKDAYVTKAMVQALMTVFFEKDSDAPKSPSNAIETTKGLAAGLAKESSIPDQKEGDGPEITLGPGAAISLPPGEHANMIESKLEGAKYAEYMKASLQLVFAAAGTTYEMALQSYSSSFSASRGTTAGAEKGYKILRDEFAHKFCQKVWEMVVDHGIRAGYIDAPGYFDSEYTRQAIMSAIWIGPTPVVMDPVKEIEAFSKAVDARFTTHENASRQVYSADWESTIDRLIQEQEAMAALAPQQTDTNKAGDNEIEETEEIDETENP